MPCVPAVSGAQPGCEAAFGDLLSALDQCGLSYGAALYLGDMSCATMGQAQLSLERRQIATLSLDISCLGSDGAMAPLRITCPAPENLAQAQAIVEDCLEGLTSRTAPRDPDMVPLDRDCTCAKRRDRSAPDLSRAWQAEWRPDPLPPMPDKRRLASMLHRAHSEAAEDLGLLHLWRHIQDETITMGWSGTPPWRGARRRVLTGAEFAAPGTGSPRSGLSWRHLKPGDVPVEDLFSAASPHVALLSDNRPARPYRGPMRLSAYALAQVLSWLGPSALVLLPPQPPGLGEDSPQPLAIPDYVTVPPGMAPTVSDVAFALHLTQIDRTAEALRLTAATAQHGAYQFCLALQDLEEALADANCRSSQIQPQHLDRQDLYLPELDVVVTPC